MRKKRRSSVLVIWVLSEQALVSLCVCVCVDTVVSWSHQNNQLTVLETKTFSFDSPPNSAANSTYLTHARSHVQKETC